MTIRSEDRGAVRLVVVDRAKRRNALDAEHCNRLSEAVEQAVGDGMRAVVITGEGPTLSAGADFAEVYEPRFRSSLYAALRRIRDAPVPVIAAVNGPAIGAGVQVAIACDLRVGDKQAVFSIPTARLGLAVDPWTITRLASLTGAGVAGSIVLGCDSLDVDAAERCGLVDRRGDLDAALVWAREIAALAPLTLAYSKRVLQRIADRDDLDAAEQDLLDAFDACWASEDLREGERARAEKRAPRFRGA